MRRKFIIYQRFAKIMVGTHVDRFRHEINCVSRGNKSKGSIKFGLNNRGIVSNPKKL